MQWRAKAFVRYHLRRIKPLGLVRRTMARVLVLREHIVTTDYPVQGGGQWREQFSVHRFLHERADTRLFGGGQLLQREGDRS